jgi:zinc finger protein-like protein
MQDFLFDSLQSLLAAAISADGAARANIIHELVCKVDEVHVTLQKHLRKEEEQLFPLVLSNFSFQEQAELVVCRFPCYTSN